MQNSIYLDRPGYQTALDRHFGAPETTLVISEMALGWNVRQRRGLLYPDLLIAFNVDPAAAIAQRGYAIEERGKPPEFVLEVASFTTAHNDYTRKREGYAAYGIPVYWRFDPTGGEFYPTLLAGDRLVDGEYRPITILQTDEGRYWGHSEVLNLDLCWEQGQLRWYDPVSRRYIPTHNDEADGRIAAESQRDAERKARIAAETRVRQLEQELRRRSQ
jgi:Uma2 family endonuclease